MAELRPPSRMRQIALYNSDHTLYNSDHTRHALYNSDHTLTRMRQGFSCDTVQCSQDASAKKDPCIYIRITLDLPSAGDNIWDMLVIKSVRGANGTIGAEGTTCEAVLRSIAKKC